MMPPDKTTEMIDKLHEQFGPMVNNKYEKQDEHFTYYKTDFIKGTMMLVVGLTSDNKLQNFRFMPYQSDSVKPNIVLKTGTGDIYGTVAMPEGGKKVPVVLILAGSGPTNRDCNNLSLGLNTNAYKLLADSLLQAGIASVRYDKRGAGESIKAMKSEESVTFDDIVNDAIGYIKMLKEDPRFSKVIVLGHSEGALIGMIAAGKEKTAAYISLSGAGERIDKILERQIGKQSKELSDKSKIVLDSLASGYHVQNIDPALNTYFRPGMQPYILAWLKYNPQQEIKKLNMPILIMQGTTDLQVDVADAEKLKKACPKATLKIVNGMNHVLKQAPIAIKDNIPTYSNPAYPLCPGFMPEILKFISSIK